MAEIRDIWLHANNVIRSARQIINENLRPLNLSSAEGNILLHLLTQGQEMGQEELVEQLDISKPAVSRALDSLEKKGYLTRKLDPDDKRARRVQLTDKAREIGPAVEQIYNRVYQQAIQGVSQEEFDYFVALFERMSLNFEREQAKKNR
jgi:MarR family transcriptional regulator, transcriptional regulator for hemolysin